jgi:hypothetical protein
MKASGGKANPQAVNDLLKKRLGIWARSSRRSHVRKNRRAGARTPEALAKNLLRAGAARRRDHPPTAPSKRIGRTDLCVLRPATPGRAPFRALRRKKILAWWIRYCERSRGCESVHMPRFLRRARDRRANSDALQKPAIHRHFCNLRKTSRKWMRDWKFVRCGFREIPPGVCAPAAGCGTYTQN